jgi:O-antigen ligase
MIQSVYVGFWILALALFTSNSALSLYHIVMVAPVIYFTLTAKPREFSLSMIALLFMVVVIALSIGVNLEDMRRPLRNFLKIKYFLIGALSVFALRAYFKTPQALERLKWPFRVFLIATSVATISGLIGLWTGYNPLRFAPACSDYRACGLFGMLMTYAYGLSMLLVTLVAYWYHGRDKLYRWIPPWAFGLFLSINLLGLFLTYTRGAYLGFLLALPFIFFKRHKIKSTILLIVIFASGLLVYKFVPLPQDLQNRVYSDTQRIAYYQAAWEGFKEKPLLGYGYRNFEPNVMAIKARHDIGWPKLGGHAHNNFLEHLAATGGLGALAFIAFFVLWAYEMIRRNDVIGEAGLVFVVSCSVSGLFQYTFGDSANVFMIMAIYTLTQVKNYKPI